MFVGKKILIYQNGFYTFDPF